MYALVDCNNFYVSCERAFNPDLNGKPVIVLSNNDGCIISRSNEAKALGIKMAEPAFNIAPLLKKHEVIIFSSNYSLYGDMSQRVMNILSTFVPAIEIYSIDESFLDLSGLQNIDINDYCKKIRKTVFKGTGIPVSVGVSQTKTLAKLANKLAKKNPDNSGIFILNNSNQINEVLKNTDVADIWGIGYNYADVLKSYKIKTAYDYTQTDRSFIKKHFSIVGVRIQEELQGKPCIELELVRPAKQAICTSRSFGEMLTEKKYVQEAVATYTARCANKLRKQKSVASVLTVFIETNRFKKTEKQYYATKVVTLSVPTNSSIEMLKYANFALNKIFKTGYRYKKAGVIVSGIMLDNQVQGNLFDKIDRKKHKDIMSVIDKINNSYGRDTLKLAAQGTGSKWKLRQEKLSPSYTTKWNDLITVNAKS